MTKCNYCGRENGVLSHCEALGLKDIPMPRELCVLRQKGKPKHTHTPTHKHTHTHTHTHITTTHTHTVTLELLSSGVKGLTFMGGTCEKTIYRNIVVISHTITLS